MASRSKDDAPRKKRTVDFDMFLRDLDSKEDENIRGGRGEKKPAKEKRPEDQDPMSP